MYNSASRRTLLLQLECVVVFTDRGMEMTNVRASCATRTNIWSGNGCNSCSALEDNKNVVSLRGKSRASLVIFPNDDNDDLLVKGLVGQSDTALWDTTLPAVSDETIAVRGGVGGWDVVGIWQAFRVRRQNRPLVGAYVRALGADCFWAGRNPRTIGGRR